MTATTSPAEGRAEVRAHLASLPDDATCKIRELADTIPCSTRHLERLVEQGRFPRPIRMGRTRIWRVGTFRAWLRDQAEAAQAGE